MAAHILIIEDNRASLDLVDYLLKASGYATFTARDGRTGLAIANERHPNLIVCDLQMPLMDGYEVMRRLKKEPALARVPVIAVTAFSMPGDHANALSAGFDGYIAKPIDPETFVATIERFLPPGLRAAPKAGP